LQISTIKNKTHGKFHGFHYEKKMFAFMLYWFAESLNKLFAAALSTACPTKSLSLF
jgi:hypothetical protein